MANIRTTGEEFNRFYQDDEYWGGGVYFHDDVVIHVDGEERTLGFDNLPPEAKVIIETGFVIFPNDDDSTEDFLKFFRRWRKKQKSIKEGVFTVVFDTSVIKAADMKMVLAGLAGVKKVS